MNGLGNPTGAAGPSNPLDAQQPKKKRSNVSKACQPCRRRRCKCDGVRPSCTTCAIYKDECYWEPREDYRKPLSRQQVQALTTRVQDLERLLREHGIEPGLEDRMAKVHVEDDDEGEHKRDVEAEPGSDLREWSQEHLVEAETGDVQVHGPTSAFRHLGKYSHDRLEPNTVYNDMSPGSPDPLPVGFARYLPQNVYMTEQQHDQALDRFFRFYACWGQRTHPIVFRRDMATALHGDGQTKTTSYSPMLHNAILAIALGFSDEPYLRAPETRKLFATKAKDSIDQEGMKPSVATVQAFAHLASYHSLSGEHNLGWLYIGMALRCGVALGLNMDDTKLLKRGNVTTEQARERNVTFWTTFIQEGLWAPYIGRSISLPEFTALPPTIDVELDQLTWENNDPPHGPGSESFVKPQPGMVSTTFVHTVKLMRIGERIMNTLYGIKADMSTLLRTGVVSEISLSLSTWLESLPPALVYYNHSPKNGLPHILMLHLTHAWLVILLHRPFYRPLSGLPAGSSGSGTVPPGSSTAAWAVKQCDRAALHVIMLLQTWHRLHNLRFCPPTAIQCCFIAGTTHLLALASSSTPKKQAEALGRAQDCINLMKLMAVSWPAGQHQQILLEGLLEEYGVSISGARSFAQTTNSSASMSASTSGSAEVKPSVPTLQPETGPYASQELQQHQLSTSFPTAASGMGYYLSGQGHSSNPSPPLIINQWSQPTARAHAQVQSQQAPSHSPVDELNAWMGTTVPDSAVPYPIHQLNLPLQDNQTHGHTAIPLPTPDWDPNSFELDRETQALLDNILRPHLDVLGPLPYDLGTGQGFH